MSRYAPVDPRNRGRYLTEAAVVVVVVLSLTVPPHPVPWWLWLIVAVGTTGRVLWFRRDLRRFRASQRGTR